MENKRIYAVIVLYNKNYKDSVTYKCLENIDDLNVIVCDNSTKNFNNAQLSHKTNVSYINMGGNKGLSKAYNTAIDFINNEDGILCLFDDDTEVPSIYFDIIREEVLTDTCDIYLPVVRDELGILSPCNIFGVNTFRIKDVLKIDFTNISAINSGMAVDLSVFRDYRYNEDYFLDSIDHDFMRTMRSRRKKIKILNVVIDQKFSGNDKSNKQQSINRFKIFKKDFRRFCGGSMLNRFLGEIIILKRAIALTASFRSFEFFRS